MDLKRTLEFTASIYDAVLKPDSWNEILDDFSDVVGARGASLQIVDASYSENKCDAKSLIYRRDPKAEERLEYYFESLWQQEAVAYEYLRRNSEKGFIPEYEGLGIAPEDLHTHEPAVWLRENYGIFFRVAARLNMTNAWWDHLSFQYSADRKQATKEELAFANLFIPHFAKAVELGRTFAVLKSRFSAVLSALDHYKIGTFITLPNGTLLLENSAGRRVLDDKDGLLKDRNNRLRTVDAEQSELLQQHITTVSATANGESMETEQLLTVTRRSALDPYILSICPLRDPENTLDARFRGAIIYVIDPTDLSVVSTQGMADLYDLTSAETAICELLVQGLSTEQIAESRSVKVETVRSQMKSLLHKTRTQSRIQLIRLALGINLPIDYNTGTPGPD